MTVIKSQQQIVQDIMELLRVLQPNADTKPGTVIRDLMVEMPASQLALLYDELSGVSNLQSLRFATGSDLDRLLSNFGLSRKAAAKASGIALFTFSSLPSSVAINKDDLIIASNGSSFAVVNGISVNPANSNLYRSVATKYKNDLDFLGITDIFAVEVTVKASTPGSANNLSKYSLQSTSIPGVSNVTNVFAFSGGSDQENDASYRNRGLAIFSGSNTGTALGYRNTALTDPNVLDVLVIEPGDPLMTRDGTVVQENPDGSFIIISEGTGGKVDLIILGSQLTDFTDGFIYQDKSNNNDPTDTKNIFVLGQIAGDANKTINRRRIDDLAAGTLPAQPVDTILEVTGSLSGSNFLPKSVDSLGRVSGNYELIKDTGNFRGSPFGFDRFHWISNQIAFQEDRIKSKFNGQDQVTFTDVLTIPQIQQNININNENSQVSAGDRSIITLLHTPATNVTRVFNVNTGERYIVTDQNVDGTGAVNTTGRIRISGNTLPTTSDTLQVDYSWVVDFDPLVDFDGKILKNNIRPSQDSVDWGLSNIVRNELVSFTKSTDGVFYSGSVSHPISAVISANIFNQAVGIITTITSGNFAGRLGVELLALVNEMTAVNNISLQNSTLEIFNTVNADGAIINNRVVVGANIRFNTTVVLPTDTPAQLNESVIVYYNAVDTFTLGTTTGNFNANQITIPATNIPLTSSNILLRVNYLAAVQDVLTATVPNLPISRLGNSFINNTTTGFKNSIPNNTIHHQNQTIQINGLSQPFLTLNLNSNDVILTASDILIIIDLRTGLEIWNSDHVGTVSTDINNNYILTLTGYNTPVLGDNTLIFFNFTDIKRTQPFTFNSNLIKFNLQPLQFDTLLNKFFVNIENFTSNSINFTLIDPATNAVVGSGVGSLVAGTTSATITPSVFNFTTVDELLFKKIKIQDSTFTNNNGIYDITQISGNTITITNIFSNINVNQISIVGILDGSELWNTTGTIDLLNNRLILPDLAVAPQVNELVAITVINPTNIRQAPSRLSITVSDQINNSGVLNINGTTLHKVASVVFSATNSSLKQNVSEAIQKFLHLNSVNDISANVAVARVAKLEKVNTTINDEVLSVISTYDVLGTAIKNNLYYANEMIDNDLLSSTDFTLPPTTNNLANQPVIGDKLRITFYYSLDNDQESLSFTRNGTLYTNKLFAFINKIFISSGFTSTSARLIISYLNQPATGSRYRSFYNYLAPKINERITIRYNYNQLIANTTFNIENTRPINADVLVKAAEEILVDVTMNIVIKTAFINNGSSGSVIQNVKDKLINAINTNVLGDTLDASDLIVAAQSVDGVDRARIIAFNKNGVFGQVLSLIAQKNQFFAANNVVVNSETR